MRASASADSVTEQRAPVARPDAAARAWARWYVDLAPHSLDLLTDRRRELVVSGRLRAFRFLHQHGQRRLESVREVAGLRERPAHRRIAVIEERVEIVDERLHFGRVLPLETTRAPFPDAGQARSQEGKRRQSAPHHRQPQCHEANGRHRDERDMRGPAHRWDVPEQRQRDHMGDRQQAGRPQQRPDHDPRCQRAPDAHDVASIR